MKRSEINDIMAEADAFMRQHGCVLPPFAYWSPDEMRSDKAALIRARGMGWDITDFGQETFSELGLFLFTVRNGTLEELNASRGMVYAEKLMISEERQTCPMHRHDIKTEDIINRGGGDLVLELYMADASGGIDRTADVNVLCDGVTRQINPGEHLRLKPGESVTLTPDNWHAFWAEGGRCLIQEVSTVNDDRTDNIFEADIGRFSNVEEDTDPMHLLVSDYPV